MLFLCLMFNPKDTSVLHARSTQAHDEARQGEALLLHMPSNPYAPKLYIESYGCAMNFSDSEIVASIMHGMGYTSTTDYKEADVIFINTCSIRDHAEQRIKNRLREFSAIKQRKPGMIVGVLGCMAERLKSQFLEEEKMVDLVIGPDAYRDLPNLLNRAEDGQRSVNVLLSREETYADISPVRLNSNGMSAFISIMRGCDNMCSFCVVPFTRGRERSRDPKSILAEVSKLFHVGYREVILLGQNVDSYHWSSPVSDEDESAATNFAKLLEQVALIDPKLRVRFSTSHPKDITDEVLHTMLKYDNICKHIHLPIQSGNSRVLEMMNRNYTREWYMERIDTIKKMIPDCAISTDIIVGFCTETEEEHQDTLSIMDYVKYDFAYMYTYSERPGTLAAKRYTDDVAEEIKKRRFNEILKKQQACSHQGLEKQIGKVYEVLIDGLSKKFNQDYAGKNSQNTTIIFPIDHRFQSGDYVHVMIEKCTPATLIGRIIH